MLYNSPHRRSSASGDSPLPDVPKSNRVGVWAALTNFDECGTSRVRILEWFLKFLFGNSFVVSKWESLVVHKVPSCWLPRPSQILAVTAFSHLKAAILSQNKWCRCLTCCLLLCFRSYCCHELCLSMLCSTTLHWLSTLQWLLTKHFAIQDALCLTQSFHDRGL